MKKIHYWLDKQICFLYIRSFSSFNLCIINFYRELFSTFKFCLFNVLKKSNQIFTLFQCTSIAIAELVQFKKTIECSRSKWLPHCSAVNTNISIGGSWLNRTWVYSKSDHQSTIFVTPRKVLTSVCLFTPLSSPPPPLFIGFDFGFDFGGFRRIAVSTVINKSMLIKAISRKRRAHNAGVYYNLFN